MALLVVDRVPERRDIIGSSGLGDESKGRGCSGQAGKYEKVTGCSGRTDELGDDVKPGWQHVAWVAETCRSWAEEMCTHRLDQEEYSLPTPKGSVSHQSEEKCWSEACVL
eukprot:TRINITY_DN115213_c0_g1_i1.p2 TRINITY_DN115213_c0_g1~~TRINITY_DN115213_c0_g1_i1.p2  ORF type:complete len:110 (-),score=25.78 TRINITY_DN115213_c0_g1_i1:15-344(-)